MKSLALIHPQVFAFNTFTFLDVLNTLAHIDPSKSTGEDCLNLLILLSQFWFIAGHSTISAASVVINEIVTALIQSIQSCY